jgi:Zn-dependent protease
MSFRTRWLPIMAATTTVREKGYLTFNPLKYTHPLFSIILPLLFLLMGGIGLPGGAVYIERWRIRNRLWLSAMSLAGPAANLLVAIILGIVLRACRRWKIQASGPGFPSCWSCRSRRCSST